jgi:hypothetical protein
MQDRYAGDVGDFLKLGLLRSVASHLGNTVRLGICWYLTPDESHNNDGRHISYLKSTSSHATSLRDCDSRLYDGLRRLIISGNRTVVRLRRSASLPQGTLVYDRMLSPGLTSDSREEWHRNALAYLSKANLVFLDPDNGLADAPSARLAHKYVLSHEVRDYFLSGKIVIMYHHADRSAGGANVQVQRLAHHLQEITGSLPVGALIGRRGSCRYFLVLAPDDDRCRVAAALGDHAKRWYPHVEVRLFGASTGTPP